MRFFGGRPRFFGVGDGFTITSDKGSGSCVECDRFAARFAGELAFLLPVLGIGVPLVFLGLPLRLGVAMPSATSRMVSSSIDSRSGIVVVVAAIVFLLFALEGLADWKSLLFVVLAGTVSSVSTVTRSLCGDRSSPTASSNCCFLGDVPRDANLSVRMLRVTRRADDGGTGMSGMVSTRGSGEDIMMSKLGAAGLAIALPASAESVSSPQLFGIRSSNGSQW